MKTTIIGLIAGTTMLISSQSNAQVSLGAVSSTSIKSATNFGTPSLRQTLSNTGAGVRNLRDKGIEKTRRTTETIQKKGASVTEKSLSSTSQTSTNSELNLASSSEAGSNLELKSGLQMNEAIGANANGKGVTTGEKDVAETISESKTAVSEKVSSTSTRTKNKLKKTKSSVKQKLSDIKAIEAEAELRSESNVNTQNK